MKYYLAVNYGYEGWKLTPYDSTSDVVSAVLRGDTMGYEFKVLQQLEIKVIEEYNENKN